ncbi:hypothetical protein LQ948_11420 [Jiella sp. MQZ9-1]|uniref:Uncharacterized protein n=1 Tax=Jiella flava TaxID=2816857 RepID=A0A939G150_9HYPH|nr:hypothetical protein [Jiella flava]MBO0663242.1 hypothetical protein [Jiella flava]MCD2471818.1 hypothetical protein [Jiella flava]
MARGVAAKLLAMAIAVPCLMARAEAEPVTLPALPSAPPAKAANATELVLPYTPYLFDFAVMSLRSVAEITYTGRRYDPITRSLVVTGLEVHRDKVHFRVGQMRLGADQLILDGVAIDTRPLPLDPTLRQVLKHLKRQIIGGDVAVAINVDAPQANYLVQGAVRLTGIGAFDINADLRGFHVLAPLSTMKGGAAANGRQPPEVRGRLASADLAFTDRGLVEALYDVLGGKQGLKPEAAKALAVGIAGAAVAGSMDKLPGGATPALRKTAEAWSAAVQAFLKDPERILLMLKPTQPFDLQRLTDGPLDARVVADLNPQVVNGRSAAPVMIKPADLSLPPDAPLAKVLAVAETLLSGRGTPQDIDGALKMIMPVAISGNRAAVGLLAKAIAVDPYATIPQEKLAPVYVALDLAVAEGLPFADESLAAIGRRLSPEEVVAAEDEAVATWRKTPVGGRQRAAETAAFRLQDWDTVRRFAYAYYEGADMPRNLMRAYGWASMAAAGGDRLAAKLRDELTRAAGAGKIVLPLDRAQAATAKLWTLLMNDERSKPGDGAEASGASAPAGANDQQRSSEQPPATVAAPPAVSEPADEGAQTDTAPGRDKASKGASNGAN